MTTVTTEDSRSYAPSTRPRTGKAALVRPYVIAHEKRVQREEDRKARELAELQLQQRAGLPHR